MLMLYALPVGVMLGWLMGGRLDRLHALQLRWAGLALIGLLVQVALFSNAFQGVVGAAAPATYVASTALVLVFVLRNVRLAGMAVVAVGAAANLAAIVANGGYMPVAPSGLAALAVPGAPGYSNSRLITSPALAPLTDVFAMPSWVPFADVFSVGDTLIAVGVILIVALVMSERGPLDTPVVSVGNSPG